MMEPVRVVFACHPRWDGVVAPLAADPAPPSPRLRDAALQAWERLVEHCETRSVDLLIIAGHFFQSTPAPLGDRFRHALFEGVHRLSRTATRVVWLPARDAHPFAAELPGLPWPALHLPGTAQGESPSPTSLCLEYHLATRELKLSPLPPATAHSATGCHDIPLPGAGPVAVQELQLRLISPQLDTSGSSLSATPPASVLPPLVLRVPHSPTQAATLTVGLGSPQPLGPLVPLSPTDARTSGALEVVLPLATSATPQLEPLAGPPLSAWSPSPLHWQTVEVDASDLDTEADLQTACELALSDTPPEQAALVQWRILVGPAGLPLAVDPDVTPRLLDSLRAAGRQLPTAPYHAHIDWVPAPSAQTGDLATDFEHRLALAPPLPPESPGLTDRPPGLAVNSDIDSPVGLAHSLSHSPAEIRQRESARTDWARLLGLAWLSHAREDAA